MIFTAPLLLVAILTGIYLMYSCRKDVKPINNDNLIVSGKILDSKTDAIIQGATINILTYSTQTKQDGSFYIIVRHINQITKDSIKFSISKENYAPYIKILKKADLGLFPNISLIPTNPSIPIGTTGGAVSIGESEGISTNNNIKLTIPQGALTTNTNISVTQLCGNNIPGASPQSTLGVLNAGTVIYQPLGTTFNKPAQISVPLPVKQTPNTSLTLLRFNQTSN